MSEQESAFLLKAQLKEELKNYEKERKRRCVNIPDEESDLTEIRTYLHAGSEILIRRLGNRESEAAEFFKKGISILSQLQAKLDREVEEWEATTRAHQEWHSEQLAADRDWRYNQERKIRNGARLVWIIIIVVAAIVGWVWFGEFIGAVICLPLGFVLGLMIYLFALAIFGDA